MAALFRRMLACDEDLPSLAGLALSHDAVNRHGLGPLCHRAGDTTFRDVFRTSAAEAAHRDAQLHRLADAFARAGVDAAPIKGAAYAHRLYADPALRPMNDIDVLVRPAHMSLALRTGRALGYSHESVADAPAAIHHAVALTHADWPFEIDLHRSMTGRFRNRLRMQSVWERATRREDGLWQLEAIDEVVLHLVHIARSGLVVPAIGYVDAARLLRHVDTEAVRARARTFRVVRSTAAALSMLAELAGDASKARAVWIPSRPTIADMVRCDPLSLPRLHVQQTLLADSPTYAWGYVRAHFAAVATPAKVLRWRRRVSARKHASP